MNTDRLNEAKAEPGVQSMLGFIENAAVMARTGTSWRQLWAVILFSPPGVRGSIAARMPSTRGLSRSQRFQTSPSAAQAPLGKVFFTSLGESAGEAFRMVLVNDGPPIELSNEPFVLEPLARVSARDVDREMRKLTSARRTTATVLGYCLEFTKQSPPPGMIFRIANEPAQRKFAAARPVVQASRTLHDAGTLTAGKTDAYLNQARQWSIWTLEQRFDERGFRRAFVEHAKKNIAGAGRKWTRELEEAVTAQTPQRWADIQAILREAETLPR
jgi:hypothetical protein